jgi:hypothetical protein
MVCLTLEKKPTFHNITKLRGAQAPQKEENKMTLTQTIEMDNEVYIIEYVMSSVTNTIKIVEMTKNGKFHRMNWIKNPAIRELILKTLEESYEYQIQD